MFNSAEFWELIENQTSVTGTISGKTQEHPESLSFGITPESAFCYCGQLLTGRSSFCSNECYKKRPSQHAARAKRRAANTLEFIGVDGEGVTYVHPDGTKEHRYVMLSVGDQTLWDGGNALDHRQIFAFLYEQFTEAPHAAYVGFFLGYDFSLWLKSLPAYKGHKLLHPAGIATRTPKNRGGNTRPFPVDCDGWEFDILPNMKRFMLRPKKTVSQKTNFPWLYVCDTGPFHQQSFMRVIEPTEKNWPGGTAPCTPEEYADIAAGKSKRSNQFELGDTSYFPEMQRYNVLENEILGRVMRTLNEGFVQAGVKLPASRWFGPGQAIQVWLNDQVKTHGLHLSHEQIEKSVPKYALDVGQASYYGGRFELFAHGHVPGTSYEYDITSAYPHAMRSLPCLCESGSWTHGDDSEPLPTSTDVVFIHGRFKATQPHIGGLPLRDPKGHILYPSETTGWYLESEVHAGVHAGLIEIAHVDEWVAHSPCGHPSPLLGVADLYELRKKVGKTTPLGKALKLLFNSAYGKMAQSVGSPRFGNPIYAAMITGSCRTIILDAISSHPNPCDDLLMIATDAVYFRTAHPELDAADNADQLGGWDPGLKSNLTLMKPGVYWDDKARHGGAVAVKSRGISAVALSARITDLDQAFTRAWETGLESDLPFILDMDVPFSIISPRLALARGKWDQCGRVIVNDTRSDTVKLHPKRTALYRDGDLLRSRVRLVPPGTETVPYERRFGFDPDELEDMFTPDGTVALVLNEDVDVVR